MQVKELENSANEAANNEDFELAANYSDQLEDIKMKILFTIKEYEKISENYLELEFKKSEAYLKQENTLLDYKEKTNNIKEIITNSIRDNQQELETIEKNKNQFIESKTKEIELKKEEILCMTQSFEEKQKEIDEKIHEKTADLQEDKQKLIHSLDIMEKEIEELQKMLNEKKLARDVIQEKLHTVNQEIESNIKEFDEEIKDCEIAKSLVTEEKTLFDLDFSAYTVKEKDFTEETKRKEEKIKELESNLAHFEESMAFLDQESSAINQIRSRRQETIDSITSIVQLLKEKKEILKEAEEYLETFNSEILKLNEDIFKFQEREKELKIKIPLFELEKKTAATNKQFKVTAIQDAARLANEIKELTAESSNIQGIISQIELSLTEKKNEQEIV